MEVKSPDKEGWQRVVAAGIILGKVRKSGGRWQFSLAGSPTVVLEASRRRNALEVMARSGLPKKDMGRPVSNKYKVSKKQWAKWSRAGQRIFNAVYERMKDQRHIIAPDLIPLPKTQWQVIRWNAAFLAACDATKLRL